MILKPSAQAARLPRWIAVTVLAVLLTGCAEHSPLSPAASATRTATRPATEMTSAPLAGHGFQSSVQIVQRDQISGDRQHLSASPVLPSASRSAELVAGGIGRMTANQLTTQGTAVARAVGANGWASATESALASTGAYLEGPLGGSLEAVEGVLDSVAALPLLHRFDDRLQRVLSLDRYRRRLASTLGIGQQELDLEEPWGDLEQSLTTRVASAIQLGLEPILITSDSLLWPSLAADLIVAGGDALSDVSATTGNALVDASASGLSRAGQWVALAGQVLGGRRDETSLQGVAARTALRHGGISHSGIPRLDEQAVVGLVESIGNDERSTLTAAADLGRGSLSQMLATEAVGLTNEFGVMVTRPGDMLDDRVTLALAPAQQLGDMSANLSSLVGDTRTTLEEVGRLVDAGQDLSGRLQGLVLADSLDSGVTTLGRVDQGLDRTGNRLLPLADTLADGLAQADTRIETLADRLGGTLDPVTSAQQDGVNRLADAVVQAPMSSRPLSELGDAVVALGDGMRLAPIAAGLDWMMVVPVPGREGPLAGDTPADSPTAGTDTDRSPGHPTVDGHAGSRADHMP